MKTIAFFPVNAEYVYFSNLKKGVFFWSFSDLIFGFQFDVKKIIFKITISISNLNRAPKKLLFADLKNRHIQLSLCHSYLS